MKIAFLSTLLLLSIACGTQPPKESQRDNSTSIESNEELDASKSNTSGENEVDLDRQTKPDFQTPDLNSESPKGDNSTDGLNIPTENTGETKTPTKIYRLHHQTT